MNMNAPLSTPTSSGAPALVVGGDLLRRARRCAAWSVVGVDDDLAEVGAVEQVPDGVSHGDAIGCRRYHGASRRSRPPVRAADAPAARDLGGTASPRATARTRSTVGGVGGCCSGAGPEPGAHGARGRAARARRQRPRRRSGRAPAASSSSRSASSRRRSAWRASTGATSRSAMSSSSGSTSWRTRLRRNARIVVRRVVDRLEPERGAQRTASRPAAGADRSRGVGRSPPRPSSRPPQQVEEQVSAWSSAVWPVSARRAAARRSAAGPGPGLEVRALADVDRARPGRRQPNRVGGGRDDVGLGRGPGPQPVVDVHRGHRAAGVGREHQQRERVGAARHRARPAVPAGAGSSQRSEQVVDRGAARHTAARSARPRRASSHAAGSRISAMRRQARAPPRPVEQLRSAAAPSTASMNALALLVLVASWPRAR